MTGPNDKKRLLLAAALTAVLAGVVSAQRGPHGGGRGGGGPHGRGGRGRDPVFVADREAFHELLARHDAITRAVTDLPDGVTTITESNDAQVAAILRDHVVAMYRRLREDDPIRRRDPLFDALFRHADRIRMTHTHTPRGIRVTTTSEDPYVVRLIQAHAQVVSLFVRDGFTEARRDHPVPASNGKVHIDPRRAVADAARDALFAGLMQRMREGRAAAGDAGGIAVCRNDAPRIAKEVAARYGVRIGRTSFRLRNPRNRAPAWAKEAITQRVDAPHFVELPDEHLGALLPIRLATGCTSCHGEPAQIPNAIGSALAKYYPQDRATGFSEGDLRGWFWVEVPPEACDPDARGALGHGSNDHPVASDSEH